MIKKKILGILLLICALVVSSAIAGKVDKDAVTQTSAINALLEGVYDGTVSFKMLKKFGDLGLGTFEAIDGEMVMLNGIVYQVKADGNVYKSDVNAITPFSVVKKFNADLVVDVPAVAGYDKLKQFLDEFIDSNNIFYAFKIHGEFKNVKTRSVPRQSKPYPVLAEVIKEQTIFEYKNIKGYIIGFWCPKYINGINVPGYHLHFISDDYTKGGHLLDCEVENAIASIDKSYSFYMMLPQIESFEKTDISGEKEKSLMQVETMPAK
ncbi:MAG: acetolactate decarboxylase [Elusimicrobiota bacterium]